MKKLIKRMIKNGDTDDAARLIASKVLEPQSTVSLEQAKNLNTVRSGDKKDALTSAKKLLSKPNTTKRDEQE